MNARRESAIIGTLLELNGDTVPVNLRRLIEHAPESFDDLRHGQVAAAIRQLRAAHKPIHSLAVAEQVKFEGAALFISQLSHDALPVDLAEVEAEPIWQAYRARRIKTLFGEAQEALERDPNRTEDVARHVRASLDHLSGDIPASLDERIAGLWFEVHKPPPDEPILIRIAGIPCATPGNLTTITGQKKTAKTAIMAAIAASAISERGDTLGATAFNPENKLVLHFDTEQSAMDHWKICESILRRAQLTESALFKSVCLTSLPIRQRQAAVHHVIRREAQRGNGVFIALIDGHGDLVRNVNDPEETADYVAAIQALAIETRSHIYGALHLNPGSAFKSRGHLGSELERKSQTNLSLEKADEVFCAWGDANRGAPIPKNVGPCFVWSNDARMHISVASRLQTKSDLQLEDARMKVTEAFRLAGNPALHYAELIAAIQRVTGGKSNSTAERIYRIAKKATYISKNLLNQWQITA